MQTALALTSESAPVITPRPYQEEAIAAVLKANDEGITRQLGVAATGTGKTVMFAELARRMDVPTLILAHRDELITQAADKLRQMWPGVPLGIVKAEQNEVDAPVVLASVQTLARQNRLNQMKKDRRLIIIDEAHHAIANGYVRIIEYFGCDGKPESPLLFGVTATPDRGDKVGLFPIFDHVAFNYDIRWGITEGYLSDIIAKEVVVRDMNLDGVKYRGGDYLDGELASAMEAADAPKYILESWKEHASDRKTLGFTPTVGMAQTMAARFSEAGISSAWASANTPKEERREILRKFSRGEIQVLFNCALWTEGFDEPSIDCVLMARPTSSRSFYQQCIGRGTRKYPGKENVLILDTVGVARRHSLISVANILGLPKKDVEKGGARQAIAIANAPRPAPKVSGGKMEVREVDVWNPAFVEAQFAWVKAGPKFALSLADRILTLTPITEDKYAVIIERRNGKDTERTVLRSTQAGVDLEYAQGIAEDYARNMNQGSALKLIDRAEPWRQKPATDKQIAALAKWKVFARPDMTAGEASDILTSKIAGKKDRARV